MREYGGKWDRMALDRVELAKLRLVEGWPLKQLCAHFGCGPLPISRCDLVPTWFRLGACKALSRLAIQSLDESKPVKKMGLALICPIGYIHEWNACRFL
jgi:hypothetical protein